MKPWFLIATALVSLVTSGAHGAQSVDHRHVIMHNQYLPAGTLSPGETGGDGEPIGLEPNGAGYPVRAGDGITFTNLDTYFHSVHSCTQCGKNPIDAELFESPLIQQGQSWTLDTTGFAPGTYRYYCLHHLRFMRGSFTVFDS